MNGKFEENLARLAFGDVTPEEAAKLEAQTQQDPRAARALQEYRVMRDGLRGLADVPDHQLSNERLRDAILARGLKSEPVAPRGSGLGFGWVWMPVAAMVFGFALFKMKHTTPSAEPQVVLNGTAARQLGFGAAELSMPSASHEVAMRPTPSPTAGVAAVPAVTTPPTMVRVATNRVHRRPVARPVSRFSPGTSRLAVNWDQVPPTHEALRFDPGAERTSGALADNLGGGDAPTRDADAAVKSPIVLIDSNPDAATGAPTATEVGTATNVVIGG